nr:ABC transporter ATP-binding protein [Propionicimonas sp.]
MSPDARPGREVVLRLSEVGRVFPGPPPTRVLSDVTLDVHRGEYVAVVGPSGSGKSSLMNILGLLDTPSEGTYVLDGNETGRLDDDERSELRGRTIGFVFQDFHGLPHLTATENAAMAQLYSGVPRRTRIRDAREALTRVGLAHRLDAEPTTLSGGERQRVAIARALACSPAVLLCDEPTGNLDSENTLNVLDLFDELHAAGLTLLVVTHDPVTASRAHRSITLRDGRVRSDKDTHRATT